MFEHFLETITCKNYSESFMSPSTSILLSHTVYRHYLKHNLRKILLHLKTLPTSSILKQRNSPNSKKPSNLISPSSAWCCSLLLSVNNCLQIWIFFYFMINKTLSSPLLAPNCLVDLLLFLHKGTHKMRFKLLLMPSTDSLFKKEKVLVRYVSIHRNTAWVN